MDTKGKNPTASLPSQPGNMVARNPFPVPDKRTAPVDREAEAKLSNEEERAYIRRFLSDFVPCLPVLDAGDEG
jgi:hypothetical protein